MRCHPPHTWELVARGVSVSMTQPFIVDCSWAGSSAYMRCENDLVWRVLPVKAQPLLRDRRSGFRWNLSGGRVRWEPKHVLVDTRGRGQGARPGAKMLHRLLELLKERWRLVGCKAAACRYCVIGGAWCIWAKSAAPGLGRCFVYPVMPPGDCGWCPPHHPSCDCVCTRCPAHRRV